MGEHDDVAERQHRVNVLSADRGRPGGGFDHFSSFLRWASLGAAPGSRASL
jgi:hypothetical protein